MIIRSGISKKKHDAVDYARSLLYFTILLDSLLYWYNLDFVRPKKKNNYCKSSL